MSMNSQGRPTSAGDASGAEAPTFTGNRALQIEESLIFEKDAFASTGVDFADLPEGVAGPSRRLETRE